MARRRKRKKKTGNKFFGITSRLLMTIVAGLLVLSYVSIVVNPAKVWLISLVGIFFIPLSLVNVFLLLWAIKRRSKSFVIPLLALVPALFFIGRYVQVDSEEDRIARMPHSDNTFKVISYNVGRFSLDNEDLTRNAEGYAKQFTQFFVPEEYGEDKWMAFANVSVQYRSGETGLVRRMHYASFPSMFRSDLFEALTVGNAPKRCPVCGRFFLTTNARRTKYCNGLAPGDPEKRTCFQVAARMGREYRELAENNPHKVKRKQVIDTIDQRVHRGTMAPELAEIMKGLARNKCDRALSDAKYANTRYNAEMVLDFLEEEARRILGA